MLVPVTARGIVKICGGGGAGVTPVPTVTSTTINDENCSLAKTGGVSDGTPAPESCCQIAATLWTPGVAYSVGSNGEGTLAPPTPWALAKSVPGEP